MINPVAYASMSSDLTLLRRCLSKPHANMTTASGKEQGAFTVSIYPSWVEGIVKAAEDFRAQVSKDGYTMNAVSEFIAAYDGAVAHGSIM